MARTKEQQAIYNRTYRDNNKEQLSKKKKEYAAKNKDRIKEYRKQYYVKNKDRLLSQVRSYYQELENRKKRMLWKVQERAGKDNIECTITIEDISIPERCPFLDIVLTHTLGSGQLGSNSSIDRIDPSLGYIPGNVQVISRKANTMKSNASKEELITFAKNVLKYYD